MKEFSFSFECKGENLAATVHLVEGSAQGVVLLPGWAGTRYGPQRILVQAARALAASGRTSIRIDFRGRGDSTGDPAQVTLDGMVEDTVAAAAWLKAVHGVDRLTFLGLCAGANVAIGAASLLQNSADAVIAWSVLPFMEHKALAHGKQDKAKARLWKHYLRKVIDPQAWKKLVRGEANVRGALDTLQKDKEGDEEEKKRKTSRRDILEDFGRFRGRCLLVFGSQDPESKDSCAFFHEWLDRRTIPHTVEWIPGAPHNFYTAEWTERVIRLTVDWLCATKGQL